MSYRTLLSVSLLLLAGFVATPALAQRPFGKLRKNREESRQVREESRVRGDWFPRIFAGDEETDQAPDPDELFPWGETRRGDRPSALRPTSSTDARLQAELRRSREIIAHQQRLLRLQQEQFDGYMNRKRLINPIPAVPDPEEPALVRPQRTINDYFESAKPMVGKGAPQTLGLLVEQTADEDSPRGLRVLTVDSRGAAAAAGIQPGDTILSVGGIKTRHEEELNGIVEVMKPGDQIEVEIRRNGRNKKYLVQFGDPPATDDAADAGELPSPSVETAGELSRASGTLSPRPRLMRIPVSGNDRLRSVLVSMEPIPDTASPLPVVRTASLQNSVLKSVLVRD